MRSTHVPHALAEVEKNPITQRYSAYDALDLADSAGAAQKGKHEHGPVQNDHNPREHVGLEEYLAVRGEAIDRYAKQGDTRKLSDGPRVHVTNVR